MKKKLTVIVLILALTLLTTGCAEMERASKDFESSMGGGLNRTLTVYDHKGQQIKTYEGKIDIASNIDDNGSKIKFELNGKRVIIYNATVIVEEK